MPQKVLAAPGAGEIVFPWVAASSAVAALNGAVAALAGQAELRVAMHESLGEWEGGFREAFDTTYAVVTTTAVGLHETLTLRAGQIVAAAELANDAQVRANIAAESRALGDVLTGGAGVPA